MEFKLSKKEQFSVEKFYRECKIKLTGKDAHISYHFYPTGIGTVVKVKSETLGVEKDITDLDNW